MKIELHESPAAFHDRRPFGWRQWLTIAVILVAAASLAPAAAGGNTLAIAVLSLPVAAAGFTVFERWPGLGMPVAVLVSLLVPVSIGTGTESSLNASILWVMFLLGIWVLQMVARDHQVVLMSSPIVRALLGLVVVSLLAFALGQLNWLPIPTASLLAQLGGLSMFILLPGAFLWASHRMGRLRNLEWMVWAFLGLGGVFIVGLLIPSTRRLALSTYQRAVFDSLFWTWMITLSFSQSVLNNKLRSVARVAMGAICIAAFYFTIVVRQSWTSGWFPGLVSVGVILLIIKPKWVVIGSIVGLVLLFVIPGLFDSIFLSGDNAYSLETRLAAWQIMGRIIKLNPVLGLGPANYYAYTPLYRILGYSVNFNSHNNFVDIVAQTGFLGLGFFLWFVASLGRELWSSLQHVTDGFKRAYLIGAIGGLVGTITAGLLGDWIIPFVYNIGLEGYRASSLAWMFLGGAVAVASRLSMDTPDDNPYAPLRIGRR